jgi:biopolymer transport protein ExbB
MLSKLAELYSQGGVWMHPIATVSVVSFSIAIERVVALYFRYNINSNSFMAQIQKLVMANNIDRAIKLCNVTPTAILPRVLKAALTRANKGEVEISNALEIAQTEALRDLTKRTAILPTLANLATLCGLLGTIVGLIEAFTAVAAAPPDMKSQLLTEALAIGLNATAFGLLIAIPTLAMYIFLNATTKKLIDDMDVYALKIHHLLVSRGKTQGQGMAGAVD